MDGIRTLLGDHEIDSLFGGQGFDRKGSRYHGDRGCGSCWRLRGTTVVSTGLISDLGRAGATGRERTEYKHGDGNRIGVLFMNECFNFFVFLICALESR